MKSLLAATLAIGAAGICPAGSADKAILAAMKLSEQPNYSWTSTVTDDARTYDIEGKTSRRGWTWMRLPMIKSVAQRLGRDADTQVEAVFKNSDEFVIRTIDGWKGLQELPKRHRDWVDDREIWVVPRHSGPSWGMGASTGIFDPNDPFGDPNDPFNLDPFPVILHRAPSREESRPYCNAQLALSHPHDELGIIVSSFANLKVEGDVVSGLLSDIGAQLLLVREGQEHIQPVAAAGAFKLFIEKGLVTKYLLRLEGILMVDRKRVIVRQTSNTVVKNIGKTAFEVPAEARRKLARY